MAAVRLVLENVLNDHHAGHLDQNVERLAYRHRVEVRDRTHRLGHGIDPDEVHRLAYRHRAEVRDRNRRQ